MFTRNVHIAITMAIALGAIEPSARAQSGPSMKMPMGTTMDAPGWHFMQDAVVFGVFNHQGGPRGGDEFKAPNWWMGMFSRKLKSSQLTFNTMFSLDPATVGKSGYREIFQSGEALEGRPLIDRQHPHDFFMQLAGVWRVAVTDRTGFTIAGGPAGEPAIGPVAFMHRASAAENPFAPLSHHTFDSTHIAFGVVTAAVDHGPLVMEGSLFNGREPDENRWNFDFGRLDSMAGRVWYRPNDAWEFQLSSAHLKKPEALEQGDITRTTTSGAWFTRAGDDFTAVTVGYGQNNKSDAVQHSLFAEGTRHFGMNSVYGRLEAHQVETTTLALGNTPDQLTASRVTLPVTCPSLVHCVGGKDVSALDTVVALTLGGVRDVFQRQGFEGGVGAGVTFYGVPETLKASHGDHPVSFQIFFRLRPPAGSMGRMWNMRMSQPMQGMSHNQMDHSMMDHGQVNQPNMPGMAAEPAAAQGGLTVTLTSPRPRAKVGNNRFEVLVKDRAGKPLTGADVSALFVMPAMPGMSEMRNEVKLNSTGSGKYSGTASVMMAGDWNVTIIVRQNGKELGRRQLVLKAQ